MRKGLNKIIILLDWTIMNPVFAQTECGPSQKEVEWAKQFSGISGPGCPIVGDGWGGWRSGIDGVKYSGLYPKSEYDLEWNGYRFRG